MPYRKVHPGLDQVLDDAALDAFIEGIPLALEEPPPALWPTVLVVSTSSAMVGLIIGMLVADLVAVWAVLVVSTAIGAAVAGIAWLEHRDP